ncbi:tail completion protein [Providencia phage PSTRCR_127]|nr:tail completion protein [Providencia phage PSTRCR_127]QQV89003.1 tail completion protein [Providencia phage PSTRCR_121]UGO50178.1 putative tail completion and sheath stabilizer [Morganella phage vB_MmoM_Rgz1]
MSLVNQTNITNFLVQIPDGQLTESFVLNVQSFILPGVRIPVTETPTGPMGLGRSMLPGSTFEHDGLSIRFLVDENFDSYVSLYKWMLTINNYITSHNTAWSPSGQPEALSLHILDNDKKDIVCTYHFYGTWPSDLGEIEFSYMEEGDPAISCLCIFQFKYFEIEKDGVIIKGRPTISEANVETYNTNIKLHPSMR